MTDGKKGEGRKRSGEIKMIEDEKEEKKGRMESEEEANVKGKRIKEDN